VASIRSGWFKARDWPAYGAVLRKCAMRAWTIAANAAVIQRELRKVDTRLRLQAKGGDAA